MKQPEIHESVFVAPTATVVGNVRIGAGSSVFFGAVLRSELDEIVIGEGTNIQDNCVIHVEYDLPVTVGKNVTVGHGAILHGCTIGDETLIGMGAIVLNGAKIGKNCILAGQVGIAGHIEIADNTTIAAQAGVIGNVKKSGQVLLGSPAIPIKNYMRSYAIFRQQGKE